MLRFGLRSLAIKLIFMVAAGGTCWGQPLVSSALDLPCPEPKFAIHLLQTVKWRDSATGDCGNSDESKVARVLNFLHGVRLIPSGASSPATYDVDLARPFDFLKNHIKQLSIVPVGTNAGLNFDQGRILIGPAALNGDWINLAGFLIHEAAHSRKEDRGHVTCLKGSYRKSPARCDAKFSGDQSDGAFGHQARFLQLIAEQKSLSLQVRRLAVLLSDSILLNNVNRIDHPDVSIEDDLIVLSSSGDLLRLLKSSKHERLASLGPSVARIKSYLTSLSIPLIGRDFLQTFDFHLGIKNSDNVLTNVNGLRDVARVYLPSLADTRPVFLFSDRLTTVLQDSVVGRIEKALVVFNSGTQFKSVSQINGGALVLLDQDGKSFLVQGKTLEPVSLVADREIRWSQITGDYDGKGAWAITEEGQLYGTLQDQKYLQPTGIIGVTKVAVGEKFLATFEQDGRIVLRDLITLEALQNVDIPQVIDIAIVPRIVRNTSKPLRQQAYKSRSG